MSESANTTSRAEQFEAAVAERKLKSGNAASDKIMRAVAILLLVVGVAGTFLAYNNSLKVDDSRDIASNQILAVGFLAITVVGAALYVVAGIAAVLRLWLLRQLVESQARADAPQSPLGFRDASLSAPSSPPADAPQSPR